MLHLGHIFFLLALLVMPCGLLCRSFFFLRSRKLLVAPAMCNSMQALQSQPWLSLEGCGWSNDRTNAFRDSQSDDRDRLLRPCLDALRPLLPPLQLRPRFVSCSGRRRELLGRSCRLRHIPDHRAPPGLDPFPLQRPIPDRRSNLFLFRHARAGG